MSTEAVLGFYFAAFVSEDIPEEKKYVHQGKAYQYLCRQLYLS